LGSKEVIGLKFLAEMLIDLGYGGNFELVPFPQERKAIDIGDYYSDFSMISNELGWKPKIGLHEGLLRTIEYYTKYKQHYWEPAQ
jgi:dTDP-glucose 4,6-dehydratase/UDP-glucose 4-epimerase